MSYSRWSNSYWYTYWCVPDDGCPETHNNAIFEICGVTRFQAAEIRKDVDACVSKAVAACDAKKHGKPTPEQIEELAGYMVRFLREVDNEYKVVRRKQRKRHG